VFRHFRRNLLTGITDGVIDVGDDDVFFFEVDVGLEVFVCVIVFFECVGWEPLACMIVGGDLLFGCE